MADTPLPGQDTPLPQLTASLLDLIEDAERDAAALGSIQQMLEACELGREIHARSLATLLEPWTTSVADRVGDLAGLIKLTGGAITPPSGKAPANDDDAEPGRDRSGRMHMVLHIPPEVADEMFGDRL